MYYIDKQFMQIKNSVNDWFIETVQKLRCLINFSTLQQVNHKLVAGLRAARRMLI